MSQSHTCPECGKELPASAPRGLCPACLFKRGLETNTQGYTHEARVLWTPPSAEELGSRFPELEIERMIGRGGMGAVYQARQKNLDRTVALKILPPEIGRDAAFAERFAREAQAMAKLNHPHIVTIHEFGEREGLYYFLMEYVDGVSLRGLLDSGHVTPKEALAIVPQICEALQFAHDRGIVHRDIKPENILLNKQGQVKIADFGLAKLMSVEARRHEGTEARNGEGGGQEGRVDTIAQGARVGTPAYMAPEQKDRPAEVDHRADIYSLGVVFYQMLTGELPRGGIEPPSRKVQIDVRLDEIVLRTLEATPERRYQQASEVKTQVETISQTSSHSADSQAKQPRGARGLDVDLPWQDRLWLPWKRRLPLVGTRAGKATIYWPGLLVWSGIFTVVYVAGSLSIAGVLGASIGPASLLALVFPICYMTYRLRQWLRLPPERLMPLDASKDQRHAGDGSTSAAGGNRSSAATMRMVLIVGVILLLLLLSLIALDGWHFTVDTSAEMGARNAAPGFGPVIERTLTYQRTAEGHDVLRLADGSVTQLPVGFFNRGAAENRQWLVSGGSKIFPGFTVFADTRLPSWGLASGDVKFALLPNDAWINFSPAQVATALDNGQSLRPYPIQGGSLDCLPPDYVFPATLTFRAGDGSTGLLQLLEVGDFATPEDAPLRLKLRYKLVALPSTRSATAEPAAKASDPTAASVKPREASDDSHVLSFLPPVVLSTDPVSGTREVAPGIRELRVTFSRPMARNSYSWCTAWEDSTPEVVEGCRFEPDGRTAILKVKLEPGRTYAYWLNSNNFHNFKDTNGLPAVPYLLIFETAKE